VNRGTASQQVFVVGIGGHSGSGKSTVARHVGSRLNAHVMSMETYSASVNHLPFEERSKQDYDAPSAIDVVLLESHLRQYVAGHAIEAPIYDFAQHLRVEGRTTHIDHKPVLIVEGILALHFAELRPHFNLEIYLDAPEEVCFHRRRVRDITERQRSTDLIQWQWENTVLPAGRKYALPSKRYADVVIDSSKDLASVEKLVYEAIVQRHGQV
jgi:uridine kinase